MNACTQPPPSPATTSRKLSRALGKLVRALESDNDAIRMAAVHHVRESAVPEVVDLVVQRLLRHMRSRDTLKRGKASLALQLLGPGAFHVA